MHKITAEKAKRIVFATFIVGFLCFAVFSQCSLYLRQLREKAESKAAVQANRELERRDPTRSGKQSPFVNGHGMKFVPVKVLSDYSGPTVYFSVVETTVDNFAAFAKANSRNFPAASQSSSVHPANVSWDDAVAFCQWLTYSEQGANRLIPGWAYRLPTDVEWSNAAETKLDLEGRTHSEQNSAFLQPFEDRLAGPRAYKSKFFGTYTPKVKALKGELFKIPAIDSLLVEQGMRRQRTNEVVANRHGLLGLDGGVWDWCDDRFDASYRMPPYIKDFYIYTGIPQGTEFSTVKNRYSEIKEQLGANEAAGIKTANLSNISLVELERLYSFVVEEHEKSIVSTNSKTRVLRGGIVYLNSEIPPVADADFSLNLRHSLEPSSTQPTVGFRCVLAKVIK